MAVLLNAESWSGFNSMSQADRGIPEAELFLRRLWGRSQSILIRASDGGLYVLKLFDPKHGSNALFNEVLGTELYRAVGLPVPEWTQIRVSGEFIERNHRSWDWLQDEGTTPSIGVHFGSRFVGLPSCPLWEILSIRKFPRVAERWLFWAAWVVDICALHCDARQAIFREEGNMLSPVFIDFGHMFGGPNGNQCPTPGQAQFRDRRIYCDFREELQIRIQNNLIAFDRERLRRVTARLPDEWRTASAEQHLDASLSRLSDQRAINNAIIESIRTIYAHDPQCARTACS